MLINLIPLISMINFFLSFRAIESSENKFFWGLSIFNNIIVLLVSFYTYFEIDKRHPDGASALIIIWPLTVLFFTICELINLVLYIIGSFTKFENDIFCLHFILVIFSYIIIFLYVKLYR